MPSLQHICIGLFTLLLLLLAVLQFSNRLDASICDTARAQEHPLLCGTPRRMCRDFPAPEAPAPLVVIAAGGSRAGSTWLFNALRILLRVRDPNTVAGWHADLSAWHDRYAVRPPNATGEPTARAFQRMGTSVLVKVHLLQDWHQFQATEDAHAKMEQHVDAVFTSYRDVRHVVRSVRDMGWGVDVPLRRLTHPDFCRKRAPRQRRKALTAGQYRDKSVWVRQALATIRCREVLLAAAGGKLKMDIKAEDMRGLGEAATVAVLRDIGTHLDYAYSEGELVGAARELLRLRAPLCNAGAVAMDLNPITHLHRGHVRVDKSPAAGLVERRGMGAIAADTDCARWLTRHGYVP